MSFELLSSEIIILIFENFSTYVELYRYVYIICKNWNKLVKESTLVKNFTVKEIGIEIDLEKYKIRHKFWAVNIPEISLTKVQKELQFICYLKLLSIRDDNSMKNLYYNNPIIGGDIPVNNVNIIDTFLLPRRFGKTTLILNLIIHIIISFSNCKIYFFDPNAKNMQKKVNDILKKNFKYISIEMSNEETIKANGNEFFFYKVPDLKKTVGIDIMNNLSQISGCLKYKICILDDCIPINDDALTELFENYSTFSHIWCFTSQTINNNIYRNLVNEKKVSEHCGAFPIFGI